MPDAPETLESRRDVLEKAVGIPFSGKNSVDILKNGDQIFASMLAGITGAQETIFFETFIYWSGRIADQFASSLAERARAGVDVKVLLDAYGTFHMKKEHLVEMRSAGVDVRHFKRLRTHFWTCDKRTHRKLLICDGEVGFAGGVGIGSEWEGDARDASEWRDTHFRFRGPCVAELSEAFWENWEKTDRVKVPRDKSPRSAGEREGAHEVLVVPTTPAQNEGEMERLFDALIALAEERLVIVTPYFNILEKTREQLLAKAAAGVTIEILLPGDKIDKRIAYLTANESLKPIVEAGITVRRYDTSMMHGKVILVDDDLASIGSPNFNLRSLRKDYEVAVVVQDVAFCKTLFEHYLADVSQSVEVTAASIAPRHLLERCQRSFLMFFRDHI